MRREQKSRSGYSIDQGVTQSILAEFVRCRVACRLMLDGWQSPAPKRATQFGSLIHALLQSWYEASSARSIPCSKADVEEAALAEFQAGAKKWERMAAKAGDKPEEVQKDLAMARAVFPAYCVRYMKEDAKKRWLEVEQTFSAPWSMVNNQQVPRRGKIDGAFEAKKDGSLWILETKTASQISDDTMNLALAFDFQSLFYILALESKLGRRVAGVLYNVVRVPQIGRGDDRTSSGFIQKVRDDIEARRDFYFIRYELAFSQKMRMDFFNELQAKLEDFRSWIDGKLPTYRNESACRGRWNCQYLPVCAGGGNPGTAGFRQTAKLFGELDA